MLAIGLVVLALYDVLFTLRVSGDPTLSVIDLTGASATTINNPGFRDGRGNGKYLNFSLKKHTHTSTNETSLRKIKN